MAVDKDKAKACSAKYRAENKDKAKARVAKYCAEARESLSDVYVAKVITERSSLKAADVPPELITLKRIQLQITREIRNQAQ